MAAGEPGDSRWLGEPVGTASVAGGSLGTCSGRAGGSLGDLAGGWGEACGDSRPVAGGSLGDSAEVAGGSLWGDLIKAALGSLGSLGDCVAAGGSLGDPLGGPGVGGQQSGGPWGDCQGPAAGGSLGSLGDRASAAGGSLGEPGDRGGRRLGAVWGRLTSRLRLRVTLHTRYFLHLPPAVRYLHL